ncbi:hypothetical protein GCM10009801_57840 [Streptomyces albiaxialis]|uniref:ABC transporter substrate-binding protein n=1 Tax=Streptomyces albiaxialis TaxID=329523 RepID=A0ABN2WH51_9ACTN
MADGGGPWGAFRRLDPFLRAVVVVAAAAVVAGVVFAAWTFWPSSESECEKAGLRGGDDRCYGVTDGAHAFFPELEPVSGRIKEQNDKVTSGRFGDPGQPYVTIALMIPMSPGEGKAHTGERTEVVREVQGAYLAQLRANEKERRLPPVRLVLANPGVGMTDERAEERVREVSDDLGGMVKGRHKLRTVFGFNLSVEAVRENLEILTEEKHIPVVGGPITAHTLANTPSEEPFPGLAKVVPDNKDQTEALLGRLGKEDKDLFLVEDEAPKDLYARSLRRAFKDAAKGAPYAPETYDSGRMLPDTFGDIVQNLCESGRDTVLFAGRPKELSQFVSELGDRDCARPLTLATVSGASTLALDPEFDWEALHERGGLTVTYATVTHPDAWKKSTRPPRYGGSANDLAKLTELIDEQKAKGKAKGNGGIGPTDLDDGRTITMYDSALTSIERIHKAAPSQREVPDPRDVAAATSRLSGANKVKGASGWICLRDHGTPYNKAVAVVRLDPEEKRVAFDRLAWPEGAPKKYCKAPSE